MRISLCFRRSGTDFRLVWLNESKNGIYLGVLGSKEESHFSYHEDGRRHVKIGSDYHLPSNDIPISDWRGVRQLHHLSMSMSKEWFSAATAYAGDEKTETVLTFLAV